MQVVGKILDYANVREIERPGYGIVDTGIDHQCRSQFVGELSFIFFMQMFFSFLLFCSFYHMKSGIFLSKIILTRKGKERVVHDKNRRRRESNNLGRTKAKNYLSH